MRSRLSVLEGLVVRRGLAGEATQLLLADAGEGSAPPPQAALPTDAPVPASAPLPDAAAPPAASPLPTGVAAAGTSAHGGRKTPGPAGSVGK